MPADCKPKWYHGSVNRAWEIDASLGLTGVGILIVTSQAFAEAYAEMMEKFGIDCPERCPLKQATVAFRSEIKTETTRRGRSRVSCKMEWRLLVTCIEGTPQNLPPSVTSWDSLQQEWERSR